MRVLHLWDSYAPGLFDRSFEICQSEGYDTRVLCMNFIGRGQAKPAGVAAVRELTSETHPPSLRHRIVRRLRTQLDEQRFLKRVRREIAAFEPDVLHVHYGTTAAILVSELVGRRKPFVVSFYGFDISQGVNSRSIRSAYQRIFQANPLAHILCDEARDRVISLGMDPSRIVDANLPLPVELYPNIGLEPDGPFRWLIPARFVEKKGHAIALRAFKAHLCRHPGDRLTCWGYGDPRWLEKLVDALGLSGRVAVFHNGAEGEFNQAFLRRLREHDVVLAPSIRSARGDDEGGPALTAVLAQIAGKPVIVSDFPGHERSVTDGVEGFVVRQDDPEALADAMARLDSDRTRAAAMGQVGRKRTVTAFGERAYRDGLLDWYGRLTA